MEYLNNLSKGNGKGKIAGIVGMTVPISFSNKHIKNTTVKAYVEYLKKYVGYDKVYIISTSVKSSKINEDYYEKDSVIFGIDRKNLFNDLEIDDLFSRQNPLIFFGGVLPHYYFHICNRLVEWYMEHGDGHYYTIQDDPSFYTINPAILVDKRLYKSEDQKPKPLKYDRDADYVKLYLEYQKTGLLHKCFDNSIVAHCGDNYPLYYNKRINTKGESLNFTKNDPKYWSKFNVYTWQGVNCNLDDKFKNYPLDRKYQSEYHGYVKHDPIRVKTTLNFYNELDGPVKVIEGRGHFSDEFKNCDKFKEVEYNKLFEEVCKDSYSSFITSNHTAFDDFISPRYFDLMLSDIITFVYTPYDSQKKYTDDEVLKEFMYVDTPNQFKERVERLINDKELYKDIKYRQRLSIYNKFKEYMLDESKKKFETFLKI